MVSGGDVDTVATFVLQVVGLVLVACGVWALWGAGEAAMTVGAVLFAAGAWHEHRRR